jgi:DNA-binding PadR family transcriptional regulator
MLHDLTMGFIKLHILYHAGKEPVYGAWLIEELSHHGYNLSPGTLYPALHSLESAGYLSCEKRIVGGKVRKYYALTPAGESALEQARSRAIEMIDEITKPFSDRS